MPFSTNFDVIFYLGQDWEGYHRQSMIECFAKNIINNGKILCIERPVCLVTSPILHTKKYFQWLTLKRGIRQIDNNLFIYTPIVAIHDHIAALSPSLIGFNKKLLSYNIKKIAKRIHLNEKNRLAWFYDPIQVDWIGAAGEQYAVYECLDSIVEFTTNIVKKKLINEKENLLVRRADVIFSTGEIEYLNKIKINPNTHYISNGVNIKIFQKALDEKTEVPSDLAKISTPRIGYIGNWADYCDTNLLLEAANRKPEWSFVLIGKVTLPSKEKEKIFKLPNIFYLGWKNYDLLPNYIKGFDLAILPFKLNRLTANADPLKTYEYMASGCPIISTDIAQAKRFPDIVKVAKDKTEFIQIAEDLLRNNSGLKKLLVEEAKKYSWEKIIGQILDVLRRTLSRHVCCQ